MKKQYNTEAHKKNTEMGLLSIYLRYFIHSFIHFISQNTSYIKTIKNTRTKSVP